MQFLKKAIGRRAAKGKSHTGIHRAGDVVGSVPTIANGIHTFDISAMSNCYFGVVTLSSISLISAIDKQAEWLKSHT